MNRYRNATTSCVSFIVLTFGLIMTGDAAQTTESQVVVIANSNSQTSIDIANYYKGLHPGVNIATLDLPTDEIINATQFTDLRTKVQTYLSDNNLVFSTHYLVTTKDTPLKVVGTNEHSSSSTFASVDSELTLAGRDYVRANLPSPLAPLSGTAGVRCSATTTSPL